MRLCVLLTMLIFSCCPDASAQFDDVFGRITPKDVDMKECPFDPEADAVVLISEGTAEYDQFQNELGYKHVRIKILKEKGIRHADFKIRYYSRHNRVSVDDIQAMTINITPEGHRTEMSVDKKSIYRKKISNRISEISFAFPEVRVGSIVEFKYRITIQGAGLNDWDFQSTLPVCFSSYRMKAPKYVEVSYAVQKKSQYNVIVNPEPKTNSVYFEMQDIPSLGEEPYMESRESNLQKVKFKISGYVGSDWTIKSLANWNEFGNWLNENKQFGKQLKIRLNEAYGELQDLLVNKTDVQKAQIIRNYVRRKITWNEADAIFCYEDIDDVFKAKKGSSASTNFILINLLQHAGLEAYPILVSERGNGRINISTPFLEEFNSVLAVVFIDGKKYYLDATDRYTPFHLIPFNILNTSAFIADKRKGGVVFISDEQIRSKNNIAIDAVLSAEGNIKGVTQIIGTDYHKLARAKRYRDNKENFVAEEIIKAQENITVDSFVINNLDVDSQALAQQFVFNSHLQNTDSYHFLKLNMFTGFETNPFLSENRVSDVDFAYNRIVTLNYIVELPESFSVDALPKAIQLVNEDKTVSFSRNVLYNETSRQVVARIKIELNKSLFEKEEYPAVREFFKKMVDLLNEPAVLQKK